MNIYLERMKRIAGSFILWIIFSYSGFSQDTVKPLIIPASPDTITHIIVPGKIIEGDTIPFVDLNSVIVFPPVVFENRREVARYDKLVYNVRKVYPYAKIAELKLDHFKKVMDTIPTEKAKKAYIKKAEKELEDQFGEQIRALTYSQGKILIKLIYRQTGASSYEIVKELRGSFSAFIWQTLAKLFGYDLKTGYDPAGEDQSIERIVQMIESGSI